MESGQGENHDFNWQSRAGRVETEQSVVDSWFCVMTKNDRFFARALEWFFGEEEEWSLWRKGMERWGWVRLA